MVSLSFSVATGIVAIYYLGIRRGNKIKVYSFKDKRHFICALFSLAIKYSVPFRVLSLKDISAFREAFLSDSFSLKRTKRELEVRGVLFHFSAQKEFKSEEDKRAYDEVKVLPVEVQKVIKTLFLAPSKPIPEDKLQLLKEVQKELNCPKSLDYSVRYFTLKNSVLEEEEEETKEKVQEIKEKHERKIDEKIEETETEGEKVEEKPKEKVEEGKEEKEKQTEEEPREKEIEKAKEEKEGKEKEEEPQGEGEQKSFKGKKLKVVFPEVFLKSSAKVAPVVSFEEYLLVDEDEREIFSFLAFFFGKEKALELIKLYNGNEKKFKSLLEEEAEKLLKKLSKMKISRLKKRISPQKERIRIEKPKEKTKPKDFFFFLKSFFEKEREGKREVGTSLKGKEAEKEKKVRGKYSLGKKRERREIHLAFCKIVELRIKNCLRRDRRKCTAFFHTLYSFLDCPHKKELERDGELLFDESFVSYKERVLRPLESFLGDVEKFLELEEGFEGVKPALVVESIASLAEKERFLELFRAEYERSLNLWEAFLSSAVKFFKEEGNEETVNFFTYLRNSLSVVGELTPSDLLFKRKKQHT